MTSPNLKGKDLDQPTQPQCLTLEGMPLGLCTPSQPYYPIGEVLGAAVAATLSSTSLAQSIHAQWMQGVSADQPTAQYRAMHLRQRGRQG